MKVFLVIMVLAGFDKGVSVEAVDVTALGVSGCWTLATEIAERATALRTVRFSVTCHEVRPGVTD